MKRVITALTLLILVTIFLVGCSADAEKSLTPEEQALNEEREMQSDAYYTAQQYVKEHLEFPESAEFQAYSPYFDYSPGDVLVTNCGNGLYSVSGKVTAKNAYGIKSNFHFGCRLQLSEDGSHWSLAKLMLNGD